MTRSSDLSVISSNTTRQHYFANVFSSQVRQRLSDGWRSRIGFAAISVVNAFFESEEVASLFTTDDSRQQFAKTMLKDFKFLYSDTKSSNPKASLTLQI
jgi:hypothetical protein